MSAADTRGAGRPTAAKTVANEFAKMRHLRVGLFAAVMFLVIVGVSLYAGILTPYFIPGSTAAWNSLFLGTSFAYMIGSPLLLAVLASRQVDIEQQSNGWMLHETSGVTRGLLCRAKLLALGVIVAATTLCAGAMVIGTGLLFGAPTTVPLGRWIGLLAAVLVVNLTVLVLHILLAAWTENQLIGMGIGLLGTVLALFGTAVPAWIAHLTPWGYYALSTPADFQGENLVPLVPAYASVFTLGIVTAAVFILVTRLSDRKEA